MKRSITTLLLLYAASLCHAQNIFVNTYGNSSAEERAFDLVVMDDGSIITFGDRYDLSTFGRTGHLLKVDANGNWEWDRQLAGDNEIYGTAICRLPNGNVLVCGYDHDVPNVDFGLMVSEYDAGNGLPVYQRTHEFGMSTAAVDVIPMADNGAIVLTTYETGSSYRTNMLCRINDSGDTLWTKVIDLYAGNETPGALASVSDGPVITGSVHEGSSDDVFVIKTDMDGIVQWEETHPSSGIEIANGIASIPTGGFYIVGITNAIGIGGLDLLAMKLDATGQHIWSRGFGSDDTDLGYGVDVMPDGGAVFTGSGIAADTATYRDLILIRTDADGDTLWQRNYGGGGSDTGHGVTVDGNHIVAAGRSDVNVTEDVLILRADMNGNALGLAQVPVDMGWAVYPNPFTDRLTIELHGLHHGGNRYTLRDVFGRIVAEGSLAGKTVLRPASPVNGMYILQLMQDDRQHSLILLKTH